ALHGDVRRLELFLGGQRRAGVVGKEQIALARRGAPILSQRASGRSFGHLALLNLGTEERAKLLCRRSTIVDDADAVGWRSPDRAVRTGSRSRPSGLGGLRHLRREGHEGSLD